MDVFRPPTTSNQKDSAWERIENYVNEDRPLQPIRKIVVKGSVDVMFRRCDKPMLIVAGETAEAVASVKTYFNGGKLVIEREGMTISFGNSRMTFHGSVGSFVMGDIVNGKPMGASISQSKVVVGVALPEAPAVKIKGRQARCTNSVSALVASHCSQRPRYREVACRYSSSPRSAPCLKQKRAC